MVETPVGRAGRSGAAFDVVFAFFALLATSRLLVIPPSIFVVGCLYLRPVIAFLIFSSRQERMARAALALGLFMRPRTLTVMGGIVACQVVSYTAGLLAAPGPPSEVRAALSLSNTGSETYLLSSLINLVAVPGVFESIALVRMSYQMMVLVRGRRELPIPWWAFVLPLGIWLLGHLDYQGAYVAAVLAVGVITLIAYRRDKSLWSAVIIHAVFNLISVLIIYFGVNL